MPRASDATRHNMCSAQTSDLRTADETQRKSHINVPGTLKTLHAPERVREPNRDGRNVNSRM